MSNKWDPIAVFFFIIGLGLWFVAILFLILGVNRSIEDWNNPIVIVLPPPINIALNLLLGGLIFCFIAMPFTILADRERASEESE